MEHVLDHELCCIAKDFFSTTAASHACKLGDLSQFHAPKSNNTSSFIELQGSPVNASRRTRSLDAPGLEVWMASGLNEGENMTHIQSMISHFFLTTDMAKAQAYISHAFTIYINYSSCGQEVTIASIHFHIETGNAYIGFLLVSDGKNSSPKCPVKPSVDRSLNTDEGSWQGKSLGTFLAVFATHVCRFMGATQICLHAHEGQTSLLHFYRNVGFKDCPKEYGYSFQLDYQTYFSQLGTASGHILLRVELPAFEPGDERMQSDTRKNPHLSSSSSHSSSSSSSSHSSSSSLPSSGSGDSCSVYLPPPKAEEGYDSSPPSSFAVSSDPSAHSSESDESSEEESVSVQSDATPDKFETILTELKKLHLDAGYELPEERYNRNDPNEVEIALNKHMEGLKMFDTVPLVILEMKSEDEVCSRILDADSASVFTVHLHEAIVAVSKPGSTWTFHIFIMPGSHVPVKGCRHRVNRSKLCSPTSRFNQLPSQYSFSFFQNIKLATFHTADYHIPFTLTMYLFDPNKPLSGPFCTPDIIDVIVAAFNLVRCFSKTLPMFRLFIAIGQGVTARNLQNDLQRLPYFESRKEKSQYNPEYDFKGMEGALFLELFWEAITLLSSSPYSVSKCFHRNHNPSADVTRRISEASQYILDKAVFSLDAAGFKRKWPNTTCPKRDFSPDDQVASAEFLKAHLQTVVRHASSVLFNRIENPSPSLTFHVDVAINFVPNPGSNITLLSHGAMAEKIVQLVGKLKCNEVVTHECSEATKPGSISPRDVDPMSEPRSSKRRRRGGYPPPPANTQDCVDQEAENHINVNLWEDLNHVMIMETEEEEGDLGEDQEEKEGVVDGIDCLLGLFGDMVTEDEEEIQNPHDQISSQTEYPAETVHEYFSMLEETKRRVTYNHYLTFAKIGSAQFKRWLIQTVKLPTEEESDRGRTFSLVSKPISVGTHCTDIFQIYSDHTKTSTAKPTHKKIHDGLKSFGNQMLTLFSKFHHEFIGSPRRSQEIFEMIEHIDYFLVDSFLNDLQHANNHTVRAEYTVQIDPESFSFKELPITGICLPTLAVLVADPDEVLATMSHIIHTIMEPLKKVLQFKDNPHDLLLACTDERTRAAIILSAESAVVLLGSGGSVEGTILQRLVAEKKSANELSFYRDGFWIPDREYWLPISQNDRSMFKLSFGISPHLVGVSIEPCPENPTQKQIVQANPITAMHLHCRLPKDTLLCMQQIYFLMFQASPQYQTNEDHRDSNSFSFLLDVEPRWLLESNPASIVSFFNNTAHAIVSLYRKEWADILFRSLVRHYRGTLLESTKKSLKQNLIQCHTQHDLNTIIQLLPDDVWPFKNASWASQNVYDCPGKFFFYLFLL